MSEGRLTEIYKAITNEHGDIYPRKVAEFLYGLEKSLEPTIKRQEEFEKVSKLIEDLEKGELPSKNDPVLSDVCIHEWIVKTWEATFARQSLHGDYKPNYDRPTGRVAREYVCLKCGVTKTAKELEKKDE